MTSELERFVEAQDGVYDRALGEVRSGRKRSHWMWFVFPQLRGLGHSAMAYQYGIASLDEAREYLSHPVLGARLWEITTAANALEGRSLREIFGGPDDLKFRSSMTLFHCADPEESVYREALDGLCGGVEDRRTIELLGLD